MSYPTTLAEEAYIDAQNAVIADYFGISVQDLTEDHIDQWIDETCVSDPYDTYCDMSYSENYD